MFLHWNSPFCGTVLLVFKNISAVLSLPSTNACSFPLLFFWGFRFQRGVSMGQFFTNYSSMSMIFPSFINCRNKISIVLDSRKCDSSHFTWLTNLLNDTKVQLIFFIFSILFRQCSNENKDTGISKGACREDESPNELK